MFADFGDLVPGDLALNPVLKLRQIASREMARLGQFQPQIARLCSIAVGKNRVHPMGAQAVLIEAQKFLKAAGRGAMCAKVEIKPGQVRPPMICRLGWWHARTMAAIGKWGAIWWLARHYLDAFVWGLFGLFGVIFERTSRTLTAPLRM